jgi:fatty acid desaturase
MIPFLTKYQAYLFLPIISGLFILNFWIYFLHPRHVLSNLKKQTWIDGISMISGHCIRTAMYMFATGSNEILKSYLIAYCACMYVSAIYNFGHFSLSHTHLDVVEDNKHKSWLAYALEHTVNISPQNPLVSWTMGYLNCQIEHHLWPSMPQYHQPNVSQKVREFCHKHGYEYKVMTYWQAWKAMILNLQQVSDRILLKNKSQ